MPKKTAVAKKKIEIIDDISDVDSPPKKKPVKNAKKPGGGRKPVKDSDDEFEVENGFHDDDDDMEEERSLKKKLNSKKDDYSDVEYNDDDEEEIKPKLKRGKKNDPKRMLPKKLRAKLNLRRPLQLLLKKKQPRHPKILKLPQKNQQKKMKLNRMMKKMLELQVSKKN